MSVTLHGYSERGMINAICDDICRAQDPASALAGFLSWFRFPFQETTPTFADIQDAILLTEQSFSDFGDPDALVLINRDGFREAAIIEAKVATGKATLVTIWDHWHRFHQFLGGEDKYRSSLFVQIFRKLRLIERVEDLDTPLPQHPIWGRQSLGANPVVLKAAGLLAQHKASPWYLAIVPDSPEEIDRFVDEELKLFVPDREEDLPGWSVSRFGFLSWSEIDTRCRCTPEQWPRTTECFEWNGEQIYRAVPPAVATRLQIGSVCEVGSEAFVVVGWSDKNCRLVPASPSDDFFPASRLIPSQRLNPSGRVFSPSELARNKPQVGMEYFWEPGVGESIQPPNRALVPDPPRRVRVTSSGWNTCAVQSADEAQDGVPDAFHVFTRHIRP